MNWVDFLIIVVVIANGLLGLIAGFIWQVAGICSLIIGLIAGCILHVPVGSLLTGFMGNENLGRFAAFIIIFFTVALVMRVIAALCKTFIKAIRLEKVDRSAGAVLGLFKGMMICCIVVYAVVRYPVEKYEQACRESLISGLFVSAADVLFTHVPSEFSEKVNQFLEEKKTRVEEEEPSEKTTRENETPFNENKKNTHRRD